MKLVLALLIFMLATTAKADLKQDAAAVLGQHCAKCHGTTRFDWDASDLASARAFGDSILEQIDAGTMPPGKLPKLTDSEKQTLRDWLAAKPVAPAKPAPKVRKFLDDAWVQQYINADPNKQEDSLYLSLANLYNAGASKQVIWNAQGAVSKAANLLSINPEIIVPAKVDPNGIVLRVNVFDLGWDDIDAAQLFEAYPYADLSQGFIRGDWFFSRGLAAPLYYRLLDVVRPTQKDTDELFGIDRERFFDSNLARRSGINNSRVAFHNRLIEWAPARTGAVRLTYDTANEERDRRIVANPLGPISNGNRFANQAFRHDAVEYIADLPNDLHAYGAFNGQGQRQDKVPENIASDPSQYSGNTSIVPGISCIACHEKGIQSPVSDEVRQGAPAFGVADLAKVQSLYPSREDFAALLAADEARYLTAVKKAIGPFKSIDEPIGPLSLEYNKPLDLKKASQESNISEGQLRELILSDADLQAFGLRPLTDGQTITRETFESLESGTSPAQRISQLIGRGSYAP